MPKQSVPNLKELYPLTLQGEYSLDRYPRQNRFQEIARAIGGSLPKETLEFLDCLARGELLSVNADDWRTRTVLYDESAQSGHQRHLVEIFGRFAYVHGAMNHGGSNNQGLTYGNGALLKGHCTGAFAIVATKMTPEQEDWRKNILSFLDSAHKIVSKLWEDNDSAWPNLRGSDLGYDAEAFSAVLEQVAAMPMGTEIARAWKTHSTDNTTLYTLFCVLEKSTPSLSGDTSHESSCWETVRKNLVTAGVMFRP